MEAEVIAVVFAAGDFEDAFSFSVADGTGEVDFVAVIEAGDGQVVVPVHNFNSSKDLPEAKAARYLP